MSERTSFILTTTDTPLVKSRLRSGRSNVEGELKLAQLEAKVAEAKMAKEHKVEQLHEKANSNALEIQAKLRNSHRKWVLELENS